MKRELVLRLLDRSHKLVSSARIEGAIVYNLEDERLGTMHSVMIDKLSGRISYAVMLLDAPDAIVRAHPLPWPMPDYDPAIAGYRVNLSRDVLDRAPALTLDDGDDRLREILEQEYPATAQGG